MDLCLGSTTGGHSLRSSSAPALPVDVRNLCTHAHWVKWLKGLVGALRGGERRDTEANAPWSRSGLNGCSRIYTCDTVATPALTLVWSQLVNSSPCDPSHIVSCRCIQFTLVWVSIHIGAWQKIQTETAILLSLNYARSTSSPSFFSWLFCIFLVALSLRFFQGVLECYKTIVKLGSLSISVFSMDGLGVG